MRKKLCGIYCIENSVNNMKYIGQSINIMARWNEHKSSLRRSVTNNPYLQNSWNKYGEEKFIFYIVEICIVEQLDEKEIFYIKEMKSHISENGYNISWGGDSPHRGKHLTKEHRDKISKSNSGRKYPEEFGKRVSERRKGIKLTEEHKKSLSESHKGKKRVPCSDETKEKISKANKGRKMPDEFKKMCSENSKGRTHTQDFKDNMSKRLKGVKKSKESNEKRSKSLMNKKSPNATSKYYGVNYDKGKKKWACNARMDDKRIYIGIFETEIEAALAYNEVMIENYGWKAKLNLISQEEIDNLWNEK